MIKELDPAWGPFLFDTSAEIWIAKHRRQPQVAAWIRDYFARHQGQVSAITVLERIRGYARLGLTAERNRYLESLEIVHPVDTLVALASAELLACRPDPPSPAKRSHRLTESRQSRLARWRFDVIIAATALALRVPLLHDNPADFEAARTTVETHPERFRGLGSLQLIRISRILD